MKVSQRVRLSPSQHYQVCRALEGLKHDIVAKDLSIASVCASFKNTDSFDLGFDFEVTGAAIENAYKALGWPCWPTATATKLNERLHRGNSILEKQVADLTAQVAELKLVQRNSIAKFIDDSIEYRKRIEVIEHVLKSPGSPLPLPVAQSLNVQ